MTKDVKQAKLGKFYKSSKKVLIKIRDSYIECMSNCEGNASYGGAMGGPAVHVPTAVPRSFSGNSYRSIENDEDLRELIRIASARSMSGRIQTEMLRRQQPPETGHRVKVMPRSMSVKIGRIDEDEPCVFEEEAEVKAHVYPRSKSYAVRKSSDIF